MLSQRQPRKITPAKKLFIIFKKGNTRFILTIKSATSSLM